MESNITTTEANMSKSTIHPQTRIDILRLVSNWLTFDICPLEAITEDWGCVGCRRSVVVLNYTGEGDDRLFIEECDSAKEARYNASKLNQFIQSLI